MQRKFMIIGAITAMLSVAIGAFGAHLLEPIVGEDAMKVYETGVQYHMAHALGIILIAVAARHLGGFAKIGLGLAGFCLRASFFFPAAYTC